jgi:DNA-binding response OmpR family regulator
VHLNLPTEATKAVIVIGMQTILMIDDDEHLRETVGILLERENFVPIFAADGRNGLDKAISLQPQLLLIDLNLPVMSGVEVCKQFRAHDAQVPIIVLSAAGDEVDKVLLLELGADDYIVKPFGARELLARIRALLRRTISNTKVLQFGEVSVDVDRRMTVRSGKEIKLAPAEYKLLLHFMKHPDRVLTRDSLLNSVWGYDFYPNSRTVDAHVVRLRQKLEPDPNIPRHFLTVHGVGYRFLP